LGGDENPTQQDCTYRCITYSLFYVQD
jgi:hypothetical protein